MRGQLGGPERGESLGQGGGLLAPLVLQTEVEVEEGGVRLAGFSMRPESKHSRR